MKFLVASSLLLSLTACSREYAVSYRLIDVGVNTEQTDLPTEPVAPVNSLTLKIEVAVKNRQTWDVPVVGCGSVLVKDLKTQVTKSYSPQKNCAFPLDDGLRTFIVKTQEGLPSGVYEVNYDGKTNNMTVTVP